MTSICVKRDEYLQVEETNSDSLLNKVNKAQYTVQHSMFWYSIAFFNYHMDPNCANGIVLGSNKRY
jgi:hypothetical protein